MQDLVFAHSEELRTPSIEGSLLHMKDWLAMRGVAGCERKILPISVILREAQKMKEVPEKAKTAVQHNALSLEDDSVPDSTPCQESSDPFVSSVNGESSSPDIICDDHTGKVHRSIQVSLGGPLLPPKARAALRSDRSRSPFQVGVVHFRPMSWPKGGEISKTELLKLPRFQRPVEGQPVPPP